MSFIKKISGKIFYGIFLGALIVFSCYTIVNYLYTKNKLVQLTNNVVKRTFRSAYNHVESQVLPIVTHAENTAFLLNKINADNSLLPDILMNNNSLFPKIYGSGIVVSSNLKNEKYSLYLTKNAGKDTEQIVKKKCPLRTNYPELKSYSVTIQRDTISLNYFYIDSLQTIYLLYDFPLAVFMNTLNRETRHLQSRHYLFNSKFESISSSSADVSSINEEEEKSSDIGQIQKLLAADKFGFFTEGDFSRNEAYYTSKIRGTNLILASVMQTNAIVKQTRRFYLIAFLFALISFAALAYVLQLIILKHTRPLKELSILSRQIEKGKLHTEIPEFHNNEETEQLAKTLRTVQGRMQKYVTSLHTTLKEKRAFTKDLSVAEKIQNDMLPSSDWTLNNLPQIDIYCKLIPAKGVAGDFYDYFFIDDERLFFILGDVSGKGIPAALFMVKAMTLMQVEAKKNNDPGKIFTAVNEQLTFRNDEGMFVTAVCGIVNIKTGELALCDAGHHEPLTNFGSLNFNYTLLTKNLPLGILIGGKPYSSTCFNLKKSDTLILYSDGLPEASSLSGKMLGHEPVEKVLLESGDKEITVLAKKIWNLYERFTYHAIGNDDVSIFILRYLGDNNDIQKE